MNSDFNYLFSLHTHLQLPVGTADALKPVMVYIHGGAFYIGSGNAEMHGPNPMMSTGEVVLVTMNYRLGALGNMSNVQNIYLKL
jgi:para-nitrobenzyl esterase